MVTLFFPVTLHPVVSMLWSCWSWTALCLLTSVGRVERDQTAVVLAKGGVCSHGEEGWMCFHMSHSLGQH